MPQPLQMAPPQQPLGPCPTPNNIEYNENTYGGSTDMYVINAPSVIDVISNLIKCNAVDVNVFYGTDSLLEFVVELYKDATTNPNTYEYNDVKTAIVEAESKALELIALMVDNGLNVNTLDNSDCTILHDAKHESLGKVVAKLEKGWYGPRWYGPTPSITDPWDYSNHPLAATINLLATDKYIDNDQLSETPLKIIKQLIDRGADVTESIDNQTLLEFAADMGQVLPNTQSWKSVITWLIEGGADPTTSLQACEPMDDVYATLANTTQKKQLNETGT
jgi:hypothetical protein